MRSSHSTRHALLHRDASTRLSLHDRFDRSPSSFFTILNNLGVRMKILTGDAVKVAMIKCCVA